MRFVDDDEIEVARAEAPLSVGSLVDETHHRRIRRDEHAAFGVLDEHCIGQIVNQRAQQIAFLSKFASAFADFLLEQFIRRLKLFFFLPHVPCP